MIVFKKYTNLYAFKSNKEKGVWLSPTGGLLEAVALGGVSPPETLRQPALLHKALLAGVARRAGTPSIILPRARRETPVSGNPCLPAGRGFPSANKNKTTPEIQGWFYFAPGVGFEPTTNSLTASCATAALPGTIQF